ncbi:YqiA/YcfP family alpha/beta fold hydrolase [Salinimicrobium gaetbulicola]|uniref:YqiA/YcfP family alpha/beta fold hydrolase n=1 Tax=Salinimicrobium gaetbulicola TaxID=999702 RepID=A0ABW3IGE5_9FLAO
MNILYLHGLKSKLNDEKRRILEKYGKVFAPDIDYSGKHIQPQQILRNYPDTQFNVVIGSSMGALNGYIISNQIGRPALLFNPPLGKYAIAEFSLEPRFTTGLSPKQLLLGGKDDVVDPKETLTFLSDHLQEHELEIKIDPNLGHRIPLDLFKEQVSYFFSKLCY